MTSDSGIFGVFSNHERAPNTHVMRFLQRHGISYHYLPTTDQNKIEEEILELVKGTDFLVLARYMQVYQLLSSILGSFSLSWIVSLHFVCAKMNQIFSSDCSCFVFMLLCRNSFINKRYFLALVIILTDDVYWKSFLWQLLSGNFLKGYGKDVINIHHGLLPSFKGRNPVKQVYI